MAKIPFNPAYGSGQSVTAGADSSVAVNQEDAQVCVTNTGGALAYVRVGSAAATAADYPILPGCQAIISKGVTSNDKTLHHFCATSTTLHIMTGNGW
jgi:hypothetical protein